MAVYGNTINGYWRVYLNYSLNNNYSATKASITWNYGINWVKDVKGNDSANNYSSSNDRPTYVSCTGQTTQYRYPTATFTKDNSWAGRSIQYGSGTFYITKKTTTQSITVKASITHTPKSSSTLYKGTSSKSVTLTVSALPKHTISFDGNSSSIGDVPVANVPSSVNKYHGVNITLPSSIPTTDGWSFVSWNTNADGSGTNYAKGASYGGNANATLYAKWGAVDPPTCDTEGFELKINGNPQTSEDIIRHFTTISCHIPDESIVVYHTDEDRTLVSIKMQIGSEIATMDEYNNISVTGFDATDESGEYVDADGEYAIYIITEDSAGAISEPIEVGSIRLVTPTWEKDVVISGEMPSVDSSKHAILDYAGVYNYKTEEYDAIPLSDITPVEGEHQWTFSYVFDESHVDPESADMLTPTVKVKTAYRHYDANVPLATQAFYSTTRNQNYSNGIYNVMFVGGVDNTLFPDHTSKAWWSKINDPLYFPDTNYIEVGSNDTAIQGLTKVGDYLAVIKQSKTTDTAIFLLYPTSFEEETTYAVKQGVQGVGALSRYSFNILGDETLFLSPKGVMAIVPTQDEEHKVQNRSYFVDKRLLAETGIENAYSFVFDGKYFLSIGNGHVYVLDGNQRNSWGNDRTVLVYECYFLDNIPASCFVKYKDSLVFSNESDVCIFGQNYTDAYGQETDEQMPVSAEWSTIFDDDGSLHYYKTMQKKGNLVSILPLENETPYKEVSIDEETFNENKTMYYVYEDGEYIQCTDDSVFIFTFQPTEPTLSDFNADKTAYWYMYDGEYIQCTDDSVFDATTQYYFKSGTYYIENRSNTKVLVKKDDKEPVEIERKFGLNSELPSELFINKKFKKYKRLQFILRNNADEDFGIDEIVKNYTVGNYAKK